MAFLAADYPDENEFSFFESADCADLHRLSDSNAASVICVSLSTIRQAATALAVPYRFADRVFAFNASVSRFRDGALVTSDSRR